MKCYDYFLEQSNLLTWTELGALFGKIPFKKDNYTVLLKKLFGSTKNPMFSQGFQRWIYYFFKSPIWHILKNYERTLVKSNLIFKMYLPCIESSLISFHKFGTVDHNQSWKLHFQQYLCLSRLCTDHIDIQQCKQKIENTLASPDTRHSVLVHQCIENNYFFGSNH